MFSYPAFHSIWLHILPDHSQRVELAMRFRAIDQTILPATAEYPDPS